jgi:NADPH:quinone reductase-like Zn-dependent oxidoreductase
MAELTPSDLDALATLARDGKLTSPIDRRYSLDDAATAIEYLEQGRARGKVIVEIHEE